jgi:hypothetical protein
MQKRTASRGVGVEWLVHRVACAPKILQRAIREGMQ